MIETLLATVSCGVIILCAFKSLWWIFRRLEAGVFRRLEAGQSSVESMHMTEIAWFGQCCSEKNTISRRAQNSVEAVDSPSLAVFTVESQSGPRELGS